MGASGSFKYLPAITDGLRGLAGAKSALDQGEYQGAMYDAQAAYYEGGVSQAKFRRDIALKRLDEDTGRTIGAMRASAGAQGIDVNSGSALSVQMDAAGIGAVDKLIAKHNAAMEAWGYSVGAVMSSSKADLARAAGQNRAWDSILTGTVGMAKAWPSGKSSSSSRRDPYEDA